MPPLSIHYSFREYVLVRRIIQCVLAYNNQGIVCRLKRHNRNVNIFCCRDTDDFFSHVLVYMTTLNFSADIFNPLLNQNIP